MVGHKTYVCGIYGHMLLFFKTKIAIPNCFNMYLKLCFLCGKHVEISIRKIKYHFDT